MLKASFHLEDGQPGDVNPGNGANDGRIIDPGGLARAVGSPQATAIPTLGEWGWWLLLGVVLVLFRRRRAP